MRNVLVQSMNRNLKKEAAFQPGWQ